MLYSFYAENQVCVHFVFIELFTYCVDDGSLAIDLYQMWIWQQQLVKIQGAGTRKLFHFKKKIVLTYMV